MFVRLSYYCQIHQSERLFCLVWNILLTSSSLKWLIQSIKIQTRKIESHKQYNNLIQKCNVYAKIKSPSPDQKRAINIFLHEDIAFQEIKKGFFVHCRIFSYFSSLLFKDIDSTPSEMEKLSQISLFSFQEIQP